MKTRTKLFELVSAVTITVVVTNWVTIHTIYPPRVLVPQDLQVPSIVTNKLVRIEYVTDAGNRIFTIVPMEEIPEKDTNSAGGITREVQALPQIYPHSWMTGK